MRHIASGNLVSCNRSTSGISILARQHEERIYPIVHLILRVHWVDSSEVGARAILRAGHHTSFTVLRVADARYAVRRWVSDSPGEEHASSFSTSPGGSIFFAAN
jgi:hypothetical protein